MFSNIFTKTKTAIIEFKNDPIENLAVLLPVFMSILMLICGTVLYIRFIMDAGYSAQIQSFRVNGWWKGAKAGFSTGKIGQLYTGISGKLSIGIIVANIIIIMMNYFRVNGKAKRLLMVMDYCLIGVAIILFFMFLSKLGRYDYWSLVSDDYLLEAFGITVSCQTVCTIFLLTGLSGIALFILLPLITNECRWMVGYMGLGVLTNFALIPLFFWVLQNILPLLGSVAFIALIIVGIWIMFKIMSALCTDHPEDIEFKQIELKKARERANDYRASADGYFKSANEGLNILMSAEDKRKVGRNELKKASAEDKYAKKLQEDIERLKNKFDK